MPKLLSYCSLTVLAAATAAAVSKLESSRLSKTNTMKVKAAISLLCIPSIQAHQVSSK